MVKFGAQGLLVHILFFLMDMEPEDITGTDNALIRYSIPLICVILPLKQLGQLLNRLRYTTKFNNCTAAFWTSQKPVVLGVTYNKTRPIWDNRERIGGFLYRA